MKRIDQYAPNDWRDHLTEELILESLREGHSIPMVVVAADIRKSTFLMRESIDFVRFAADLGEYISDCRDKVKQHLGWFDKFTGDGFLAYWVYDDGPDADMDLYEVLNNFVLPGCSYFLHMFNEHKLLDFRRNARNLPTTVGLSLGIDAGPTHLVEMGADLTIVGPTVVGAVRMVSAAQTPGEVCINVHPGSLLHSEEESERSSLLAHLEMTERPSKEYPEGQTVYVADLLDVHGPAGR